MPERYVIEDIVTVFGSYFVIRDTVAGSYLKDRDGRTLRLRERERAEEVVQEQS